VLGKQSRLDNHWPQLCPLLLHQKVHPRNQPSHRTKLLGEIYCAAPASRVGHDCSTRCVPAGRRNCSASSRCMWFALGLATHLVSPSRVICWSPRMILPRRLGCRRCWWRGFRERACLFCDLMAIYATISDRWKVFSIKSRKKEIISDATSDLNIFINFDPFWDDAC
jgi:hypothetical protein